MANCPKFHAINKIIWSSMQKYSLYILPFFTTLLYNNSVFAADFANIQSCTLKKDGKIIKSSEICLNHSSMAQGVYSGSLLWEDDSVSYYEGDFNNSLIDVVVDGRKAVRSDFSSGYCFTYLDDKSQLCVFDQAQKANVAFLASCTYYQENQVIKSNHFCAVQIKTSKGLINGRILWNDGKTTHFKEIRNSNLTLNVVVDKREVIQSNIGIETCFTFLDDRSRICIESRENFNPLNPEPH